MDVSDFCLYVLVVIAIVAAIKTPVFERLWLLTKRKSMEPSYWGVYDDSQSVDPVELKNG